MEEVTGLEELSSLCNQTWPPRLCSGSRDIISDNSAVTECYELCGLADYFRERGRETY